MDEKVYTPEVIVETPFPGDPLVNTGLSPSNPSGVVTPTISKEKTFPVKKIALELLSTALNTRSKKILQEFKLQQSGGLKIGNFEEGISGEVDITPNGLLGRNIAGLTTFALDTDGNLILVGELRSGSLITGDVIVQDGGRIRIGTDDTATVFDELGIVSANNFRISNVSTGLSQTFTNTSYADVPTCPTITLTIPRNTKALVSLSIVGSSEQATGGLDCSGRTYYRVYSDVTGELTSFYYDSFLTVATGIRENIISKTYSSVEGVTLGAGTHTISLQSKLESVVNFRSSITQVDISVLLLGN